MIVWEYLLPPSLTQRVCKITIEQIFPYIFEPFKFKSELIFTVWNPLIYDGKKESVMPIKCHSIQL